MQYIADMQRQIEVSLKHDKIMKNFSRLIAIAIIMLIFAGVGYVTYLCFANVSEQNDPEANVVLIFTGVAVPIATLLLTFDFKSSSSNSK